MSMFRVSKNVPLHDLKKAVEAEAKQEINNGTHIPHPEAAIAFARGGYLGLSDNEVLAIQQALSELQMERHTLLSDYEHYRGESPEIFPTLINFIVVLMIIGVEFLSLSYCYRAILEPGVFPLVASASTLYLLSMHIGNFVDSGIHESSNRMKLYLFIGLVLAAMRASGGIIQQSEAIPIAIFTGLITGLLASMMGLFSFYSIPKLKFSFKNYWDYIALRLDIKGIDRKIKDLTQKFNDHERLNQENKVLGAAYLNMFEARKKVLDQHQDEFGDSNNFGGEF